MSELNYSLLKKIIPALTNTKLTLLDSDLLLCFCVDLFVESYVYFMLTNELQFSYILNFNGIY